MGKAITLKNISLHYEEDKVLDDINAEITKGKITALIGPNGAGKSSLIHIIMNIVKATSGTVIFEGIEEAKNNIAFVPQTTMVDWDFPITVIEVVMMGRYGHLGWFKSPGIKEKKIAMKYLESVEMLDFANRQISQLSGGQQQRIFLARALAQEAPIYILDEPLKGVDAKSQKIVMDHLLDLKNQGKTVLLVHHDLNRVDKYFDEVILLNKKLVVQGKVADVFTKENIANTYGCNLNNIM